MDEAAIGTRFAFDPGIDLALPVVEERRIVDREVTAGRRRSGERVQQRRTADRARPGRGVRWRAGHAERYHRTCRFPGLVDLAPFAMDSRWSRSSDRGRAIVVGALKASP